MTSPVSLTRLREITGGDRELETELFALFTETGKRCIATMETALNNNAGEAWQRAAHELKGASANLGADTLKEWCRQADTILPQEAAAELLGNIETEFEQVMAFLATVSYP